MKKVVAALLIVTVLCGAAGIAMAESRLEVAQAVQDYSDNTKQKERCLTIKCILRRCITF